MNAPASLHPADQTLQAFCLGKLKDSAADAVGKHMDECEDCRKRAGEVSGDSFLVRLRDAHGSQPMAAQSTAASRVANPTSAAGDTIPPGLLNHPDYEILRELGRGGMGVVYLAENKMMGRQEVLKVVGKHLMQRPSVLNRFLREIRSAAKLQHPNIVSAYAAMRLGESVVLAMEYVEGEDLSQLVKTRGPLPVANACYFIYQAALGLQHAHQEGLVHRDVKPANLILSRDGKKATVKVLDFGLAKVTSEGNVEYGLTHEGQLLGTPDYMSPEQTINAQKADIRADIYSLGCTFYYLLSGGPPFHGTSLYDLLQAHHSMDAMPLNLKRPEVPVELAALIAKMMAKEPERRFQTPSDVAQALIPFFKPAPTKTNSSTAEMPQVKSHPPELAPESIANTQNVDGWNTLINFGDSERNANSAVLAKESITAGFMSNWKKPPVLIGIGVGVLLLGSLFGWMWTADLRVKTKDGVIVLKNLPEQSDVLVDGEKVNVRWPDGGGAAEISIPPGAKGVEVRKNGFRTFGQRVSIALGERQELQIELEKLEKEAPKTAKDAENSRINLAADAKNLTFGNGGPLGQNQLIRTQPPDQVQQSGAASLTAASIEGTWSTEGDELIHTHRTNDKDKDVSRLYFGDPSWSEYTLTLKAKLTSGDHGFAVGFHTAPPNTHYGFLVGGYNNSGSDLNYCLGDDVFRRDDGKFRPGGIEKDHWYNVKIVVNGADFCCLLDGTEFFRAHDLRFTHGLIFLSQFRSSARFRDIKLIKPDGTILFEGLPRLPAAEQKGVLGNAQNGSKAEENENNRPENPASKHSSKTLTLNKNDAWDSNTEGVVSIFNGKKLVGFKQAPEHKGAWGIEGGLLYLRGPGQTGSGPAVLVSSRDDYRNFRLRASIANWDEKPKQILLRRARTPGFTNGYGVLVSGMMIHNNMCAPMGSINKASKRPVKANFPWDVIADVVAPEQPNVVEIRVVGNHIWTVVNKRQVGEYTDERSSFATGEIALVCRSDSEIKYNEILIQELDDDGDPLVLADGDRGPAPKAKGKEIAKVPYQIHSDAFIVGSVWDGELTASYSGGLTGTGGASRVCIRVLERNKTKFTAEYEIKSKYPKDHQLRVVRGEVRNEQISWLAKDVIVKEGHEGQDHTGLIKGDKIKLNFEGEALGDRFRGQKVSGTLELTRRQM